MASKDVEVEFSGSKQKVRVKPVNWNESTLSVKAAGEDDLSTTFSTLSLEKVVMFRI